MTSFPILHTPLLPLTKIFRQMDPLDLIELTTLKPEIKNFVAYLKMEAKHVLWKIQGSDRTEMVLEFEDGRQVQVICADTGKSNLSESQRIINNREMMCSRTRTDRKLVFHLSECPSPIIYIEDWTEHLLSMYKVETFRLSVWTLSIDCVNFFVWKFAKKFEKVSIYQLPSSSPRHLTSEDVDLLLTELSVQKLALSYGPYSGPDKTRILKHPDIEVEESSWLSFEDVLNSESTKLEIKSIRVTSQNLNELLKSWYNSEKLQNLKLMTIDFPYSLRFDKEEALCGIELLMPFYPPDHLYHVYAVYKDIWGGYGRHLRRPSDEKWATLFVYRDYIRFAVWED